MFRFFIFMAGVMAVSTGIAGEVSPCPVDTVPIQIMTPNYGGSKVKFSADEISRTLPHFRAFVTAVTERVATQLAKEKLCITGAKDMESMGDAAWMRHSLLQFVYWPVHIYEEYTVPMQSFTRGTSGCLISSPWIDFTFVRTPVPVITGVVRWNERQLFADQAVLAGVRNVPTGVAMPLNEIEIGQFIGEYTDTDLSDPRAVKLLEERIPPDILWGLRRPPLHGSSRDIARMKGAEGYAKLVIALLDRCFASNNFDEEILLYHSIIDIDDPVLLEQYKIDMQPFY